MDLDAGAGGAAGGVAAAATPPRPAGGVKTVLAPPSRELLTAQLPKQQALLRTRVHDALAGPLSKLKDTDAHAQLLGYMIGTDLEAAAKNMRGAVVGALANKDLGAASQALSLLAAPSPKTEELVTLARDILGGLLGADGALAESAVGQLLERVGTIKPQNTQRAVEEVLGRLESVTAAAAADGEAALAVNSVMLAHQLERVYLHEYLPLVERLGHTKARSLWQGRKRKLAPLREQQFQLLVEAVANKDFARAFKDILGPDNLTPVKAGPSAAERSTSPPGEAGGAGAQAKSKKKKKAWYYSKGGKGKGKAASG